HARAPRRVAGRDWPIVRPGPGAARRARPYPSPPLRCPRRARRSSRIHAHMTKTRFLAVLAAAALLVSACGGSTKESAADKYAQKAEQEAKTQPTAAATDTPAPTVTKV